MTETGSNDAEIRSIERAFYRIDDGETDFPTCSVAIEITGIGSWIVKFSVNGIVVNNCDIVFAIEPNDCSARIQFKSHSAFWTVLNGGERYQDGVSKGNITEIGLPIAIELIKRKMFHTVDVSADKVNRMELINGHSNVPIKAGWLLKKRDFIFGWQCRYFVAYVGRVEYYIDQHDQHPKGVIQLFGAEITTASKCPVNGVNDHWSISIEPRNKERVFRLASELTGEEGMVDATSWVQVFMIAARPAESATGLYGTLPPPRNVNPQADMADSNITSRGTLPMHGKSIRDKERTIRKNTDLVPTAIVISIFSITIGWFFGQGVQIYFPSTSIMSTFGVIILTTCICFSSSFLLGLFDYRWTHLIFNVNNSSSSGNTPYSGSSSAGVGRAIRRPSTSASSSEYANGNYCSPAPKKISSVAGTDAIHRAHPSSARRERNSSTY